jgi:hypothetical protein
MEHSFFELLVIGVLTCNAIVSLGFVLWIVVHCATNPQLSLLAKFLWILIAGPFLIFYPYFNEVPQRMRTFTNYYFLFVAVSLGLLYLIPIFRSE